MLNFLSFFMNKPQGIPSGRSALYLVAEGYRRTLTIAVFCERVILCLVQVSNYY